MGEDDDPSLTELGKRLAALAGDPVGTVIFNAAPKAAAAGARI